ncbi:hypothetical protein JW930_01850 [Candidatus Woesearchaeota archaeon]|nr:hypothetical protein [Candidatus Woesearchaeota archaeon]
MNMLYFLMRPAGWGKLFLGIGLVFFFLSLIIKPLSGFFSGYGLRFLIIGFVIMIITIKPIKERILGLMGRSQ